MSAEVRRAWEKDRAEFCTWINQTFPGQLGKSRREKFHKLIVTMRFEIAHNTDEMNQKTADFEERVRKYDKDHKAAGWYISTMNKWEAFHKERSGEVEEGSFKAMTEERDRVRAGGKAQKGASGVQSGVKRPRSQTKRAKATRSARDGKFVVATSADLKLLDNGVADFGYWRVWLAKSPPEPADTANTAFFQTAFLQEDCKMYFKNHVYRYPLWVEAVTAYAAKAK